MLNWSATELAERAGTSRNTIQRLEQSEGVPASRTQTLMDIQRVFEAAGIEFIGTPENGPGVRIKPI
jgi:transcriptional regulator with XRE-family HTH domain